jgi:hypothetical protein
LLGDAGDLANLAAVRRPVQLRTSVSLAARLHSRLAYALLRLSIPKLPAGGLDYVLISRRAMDTFNAVNVRNRFLPGATCSGPATRPA